MLKKLFFLAALTLSSLGLWAVNVGDDVYGGDCEFKVISLNPNEVEITHCYQMVTSPWEIPSEVTYDDVTFSVTAIAEHLTISSNPSSVVIPNTVRTIGARAFAGFYNLSSITLGNSVTTIGEDAFSACPLTSIELPASITTIEDNAFNNNGSLTEVTVHWDQVVPQFGSEISDYAFGYYTMSNITIHIPVGMTDVYREHGWIFDWFGEVIDDVNLPSAEEGDVFVRGGNKYQVLSLSAKTAKLIEGSNPAIPSSVTYRSNTFYVTEIGDEAFKNQTGIGTVELPSTLTHIGNNAFANCSGLTDVYISSFPSVGSNAFAGIAHGQGPAGATLHVPNNQTAAYAGWQGFGAIVDPLAAAKEAAIKALQDTIIVHNITNVNIIEMVEYVTNIINNMTTVEITEVINLIQQIVVNNINTTIIVYNEAKAEAVAEYRENLPTQGETGPAVIITMEGKEPLTLINPEKVSYKIIGEEE